LDASPGKGFRADGQSFGQLGDLGDELLELALQELSEANFDSSLTGFRSRRDRYAAG
jgi:hypothetical protein